ncbi:MAG: ATP-binding protein, partial [Polyangia bacterium]
MDAVGTLRAEVARALARLPGGRWVVACSGGPDSTALCDALEAIGGRALHVVAVDHGLRAEAAAEAAAVIAAARARGLEATALGIVVDG